MGNILTAAEQALLLIDIVITQAALVVWAFWNLEQLNAKMREHFSWRKYPGTSLLSSIRQTHRE
jgi:hypothetical protein